MDVITENLLNQFSGEHGITALPESKRFEHFAAFLMVNQLLSTSFDTTDVVVGDNKEKDRVPIQGLTVSPFWLRTSLLQT